ncbi:MAG: N-acetylglucosamine malate deacetylase 1 [Alphaproteobacteria bacterium]|jgi:LmbE family N-acetylglucosaminyl deacetylase|nr:N-acetylglucosamine malate deacetylase 1 [Alphaproteobacteria bacterium]
MRSWRDHVSVLVIAPHALDEVLGCGGTIAVHAAAGSQVHILVLCGDGTGHDARRRDAARQAADLLGAQPPCFAGFPENRSDTVPLCEMVGVIERAVSQLRPSVVYVSNGSNLNIDHQTAFRAAATALRPVPDSPVVEFYGYEIPSSTDWAPPGLGNAFHPSRFIEITTVLSRKLKALEAYSFDMRAEPHARSLASLKNLAHARGATVGVSAAEAFTVLRVVVREVEVTPPASVE